MLSKIGFIVGPDFVRALDGAYWFCISVYNIVWFFNKFNQIIYWMTCIYALLMKLFYRGMRVQANHGLYIFRYLDINS